MSLTLQSVGRRYGDTWILQNLNLEVGSGECLALLGPSGCGKSTALRLIAGLETPDEGSILINGEIMNGVPPDRRRVAMVFQSYALFPHLCIRENLNLGLRIRGGPRRTAAGWRRSSRMQPDRWRNDGHRAVRQRQRVALARALLRDPLVYLLDEPMSNLDAQLREELRPELKRLVLQGPQPVVYVTHDQQEAMALADCIAAFRNGRIEQIETPGSMNARRPFCRTVHRTTSDEPAASRARIDPGNQTRSAARSRRPPLPSHRPGMAGGSSCFWSAVPELCACSATAQSNLATISGFREQLQ